MIHSNNFTPNAIQLATIPDNAFNHLFYGFISNHDYSSLQGKIKALQHFLRAIDELENNTENQGILLHWASIGSAFGAAASISGIALLNPLIGAVVAASAASSAGIVITSAIGRNAKIKPILAQIRRYKLALKSSPINDWAALWEYLDDVEQFLDCLYEASLGIVVNFKLVRDDKKNPFAASLDYLLPQLNIDRDILISNLRAIKNGGKVKATKPVETEIQDSVPVPRIVQSTPQDAPQDAPLQPLVQALPEVVQTSQSAPQNDGLFEVIKHLSDKVQNSFIVGLPGSGKDFLVSHATRILKQNNPNHKLFLIDCKNDFLKEYGYYEHFDYVERIPQWDYEATDYVEWFKTAWGRYEQAARRCESEGKKILVVINEGTRTGQCFSQINDSFIKGKLTAITSSGDSRGRNIWFMVQAPQLSDLGFGDNVRSQLLVIAILHNSNLGTIGNWWRTNILGKQLSPEELQLLLAKSPRDRIIYSGKTMQWYPVPELPNHSGYDRDKCEFLQGYAPPKMQQNAPEEANEQIHDSHVATATKRKLNGDEQRLLQLLDMLSPGMDNLIKRFAVENNQEHQRILFNRAKEVCEIADRQDLISKFELE
jgi:hypothetical protein